MKIEKSSQWLRIGLFGEIDLDWYEDHRADIELALRDCPALVIIDVEHVSFMDSTGLSLLVQAYHRCQLQDGEVYVLHAQPKVARMIGVAGLDQVVTVATDSQEVRHVYERMAQTDPSNA